MESEKEIIAPKPKNPLLIWSGMLAFFILFACLFTPTGALWLPVFLAVGILFLAGASSIYYFRSAASTFFVVLGLLMLFAAFSLYFRSAAESNDSFEAERARKRIETRMQLEKESSALLNSVGWADPSKGLVHIPINDAMTMELAALKSKTPHPAYAIAVLPPPAAVAPANGKTTTPAVVANPSATPAVVTPASASTPLNQSPAPSTNATSPSASTATH